MSFEASDVWARLEAAGDDPAALAVVADELVQLGDPLGDLLAHAARGPVPAELEERWRLARAPWTTRVFFYQGFPSKLYAPAFDPSVFVALRPRTVLETDDGALWTASLDGTLLVRTTHRHEKMDLSGSFNVVNDDTTYYSLVELLDAKTLRVLRRREFADDAVSTDVFLTRDGLLHARAGYPLDLPVSALDPV